MSDIGLDVGLANELKLAFRRHDYTLQDVQRLKEGDVLHDVLRVLRGTDEVRPISYVIDLDSPCELPLDGAERMSLPKSGVVKIELRDDVLYLDSKVLKLFLSEKQRNGMIKGHDLHKELEARGENISAKVLDWLVVHPQFWPESLKPSPGWLTPCVYFWGDIFTSPVDGSLIVRYGSWQEGRVESDYRHLDYDWTLNDLAVSSIS